MKICICMLTFMVSFVMLTQCGCVTRKTVKPVILQYNDCVKKQMTKVRNKFHIRVIKPNPNVDYKIAQVEPNPDINYKIRIIEPQTDKEVFEFHDTPNPNISKSPPDLRREK